MDATSGNYLREFDGSTDRGQKESLNRAEWVALFRNWVMHRNNLKPILFLIVAVAATLETEGQTAPHRSTISASQIAKNTLPSVVAVITEDSQGDTIFGSGFFIGTNLIATNYHVVKNASRITVKLVAQKKRFLIEDVVAIDEERDLAILKVEGLSARPLTLGLSKPNIGDEIYVVGNPEGLEGTFSQGIVSARRHDSLFQITAPISHGSSGGPVLNKRGEVIGMVIGTIAEGQNLNFAISALELATFKQNALRKYGIQAVASDIPPLPYKLPNLNEIPTYDAFLSREKGDKFFRDGLFAEAVKEYKKAIGMSPEYAEAQLGLANAYIKLNPDDSFAYIKLAEIYEKLLRTDEAIQSYKQAVVIDIKNDLAQFRLGELYLRIGNRNLADQKYRFLRFLKSRYADELLADINK